MTPHKKRVRFCKARSPIISKNTESSNVDGYADLVIHYLSKLKKLFQSPDGRSNVSTKSILKKKRCFADGRRIDRQTVLDIVNAALQYGCANQVIEKMGNYFLVPDDNCCSQDIRKSSSNDNCGSDQIELVKCASCNSLTEKDQSYQTKQYDDFKNDYRRRKKKCPKKYHTYCSACYTKLKMKKKSMKK